MRPLRMAAPCSVSWQSMRPTETGRFCETCLRHVHDLRRVSEAHAQAVGVLFASSGSICARMRVDADSHGIFEDRRRSSPQRLSMIVATLAMGAGCGAAQQEPTVATCRPSFAIASAAVAQPAIVTDAMVIADANDDSDGDGITNANDVCPDQPSGTDNGCPPRVVVVESGGVVVVQLVRFAAASTVIPGEAIAVLDEVAKIILTNPQLAGRKVAVEGHADSSERSPQTLSVARAQAAVSYLVARGVHPGILVLRGMGTDKPIAANATKEGRAQNRRIEFHLE